MKRNRRPQAATRAIAPSTSTKLTSGSEGVGGRIANRPLADPTTGRRGCL